MNGWGGPGPRATPTIQAGRVYALGATGILNCLDFVTGQRLWSRDILDDNHTNNTLFGMCGSPLVVGQLVIVSPGGSVGSLVAYDALSGEIVWRGGTAQASYSSPHLANLRTQSHILIFNGEGLYGHQLTTGAVLWSYPWISNPEERNNVGQPVIIPCAAPAEGRILIASGYDRGCVCLEIHHMNEGYDVRAVWTSRHLKTKFSSVVLHDHYVYGLDERILTCLDVESGRTCWKGGRYGHGQILLVNHTLVIQCESGSVAFVEASPKRFREIGQIPVFRRRTWSQPVVAGRYLLVRNDQEAACFAWPRLPTAPSALTQD